MSSFLHLRFSMGYFVFRRPVETQSESWMEMLLAFLCNSVGQRSCPMASTFCSATDYGEGLPAEQCGIFEAALAGGPAVRLLTANSNVSCCCPRLLTLYTRRFSFSATLWSFIFGWKGNPFALANGLLYLGERACHLLCFTHRQTGL